MNRLELVIETLRAALNEVATVAPGWLAKVSMPEWFERYRKRAEQSRLPAGKKAREAMASQVGKDGFALLGLLKKQQAALLKLKQVEILNKVWQQQYAHKGESDDIRWRKGAEMLRAAAAIESPYDTEAHYSRKDQIRWTGYKVHLTETCDEQLPRLIINVHTTPSTTQDVACTAAIQDALSQKHLVPSRHFVDAGYIDADLLVCSARQYAIELFGPTRSNSSWQSREGGVDATQFEIDWDHQQAICPAGKRSVGWQECQTKQGQPRQIVKVKFDRKDCLRCEKRSKCVRSQTGGPRQLLLQAKKFHQALEQTRERFASEKGREEYQNRAGIEGTVSQGVRRGGVRCSRYIGLEKTHLQEVATAAGINLLRAVNFLHGEPIAETRISRFARLAP
jgi:transposase